MSEPYKIIEEMRYEEIVYYDADGNELARDVQQHNATCYEASPRIPLSDQDIENYSYVLF